MVNARAAATAVVAFNMSNSLRPEIDRKPCGMRPRGHRNDWPGSVNGQSAACCLPRGHAIAQLLDVHSTTLYARALHAHRDAHAMDAAEVIIVGAGPVGLCLAALLAERGIEVLVLEAADSIERDLRASTFHPPTLDMLDRLGVTPRLLEQGLICPAWQIRWHPQGERAVFDLSVLADVTAHPYRLQVEQWKLSLALHALVENAGTAELALQCTGHRGNCGRGRSQRHGRDSGRTAIAAGTLCRRLRRRPQHGAAERRLILRGHHLSRDHDSGDHAVSVRAISRRHLQRDLLLEGAGPVQPAARAWPLARLDLSARGCADRGADDAGGAGGELPGHRAAQRALSTSPSSGPIACICASRRASGTGMC